MKFIIRWNAGFGERAEAIEADSLEEAELEAYENWHDEVQSNGDYGAVEYTEELAEQYDLSEESDQ
jgi:hypothetical protein